MLDARMLVPCVSVRLSCPDTYTGIPNRERGASPAGPDGVSMYWLVPPSLRVRIAAHVRDAITIAPAVALFASSVAMAVAIGSSDVRAAPFVPMLWVVMPLT